MRLLKRFGLVVLAAAAVGVLFFGALMLWWPENIHLVVDGRDWLWSEGSASVGGLALGGLASAIAFAVVAIVVPLALAFALVVVVLALGGALLALAGALLALSAPILLPALLVWWLVRRGRQSAATIAA